MEQGSRQAPGHRLIQSDGQSFSDTDSVLAAHAAALATNEQGLIDNPLLHLKPEEVDNVAKGFIRQYHLKNHEEVFVKAGKILRDSEAWSSVPGLTAEEKLIPKNEKTLGFWHQSKQLQVTIITLCVAAVVQGWNQTSTNGANLNWPQQLGLSHLEDCDPTGQDVWVFAIVNAATYFSASMVGCWLSDPVNEYLTGRRAAICLSAFIILASVVGGACTRTWQELLVCRFLLGIGMGCNASVVPIFAAEVAPAHIRGSLVMNWQLFDAFGIFLRFTANLAVSQVGRTAWRWQIASSALPTIVLLTLIYVTRESPRFLMKRKDYKTAYHNLILLRFHPILAAKELLYVHCQMELENRFLGQQHLQLLARVTGDQPGEKNMDQPKRRIWRRSARKTSIRYLQKLYQLFTIKRNQRAIIAAVVCMVSQQLCGINTLQFFSSTFYCDTNAQKNNVVVANQSYLQPLFLSWGIGLAGFMFAFPAYYFIDRKGRRWLLLVTIPLMAITILAAGLAFLIPTASKARTPVIGLFTFIFVIFYSFGMGPVPFTLSAEVFPLESRVAGMSFAVFTNLFGAGLLALFVPALTNAIGHGGLLCIFGGLNIVAFVLVFFFVRETAGAAAEGSYGSMTSVSLEELNYIFGVSTATHAIYQRKIVLPWAWRYYILRDKSCPDQPEQLYTWASVRKREVPKTV